MQGTDELMVGKEDVRDKVTPSEFDEGRRWGEKVLENKELERG